MLQDRLPDRLGSSSCNALDLHIMRLRRRIAPLGLSIRTVWRLGYLIEAAGVPTTNTAAELAALRWPAPTPAAKPADGSWPGG